MVNDKGWSEWFPTLFLCRQNPIWNGVGTIVLNPGILREPFIRDKRNHPQRAWILFTEKEIWVANNGSEHFSTLVAIVTKLACFFISVSDPAELAIYIATPVISLAQTVLGSDMKKLRSLSVEA